MLEKIEEEKGVSSKVVLNVESGDGPVHAPCLIQANRSTEIILYI